MRSVFRYFLLCLLITGMPTHANVDEETRERAYPIPQHGQLILNVPASWEVTYFSPAETRPPVITFFKKNNQKRELFQLNLSVLWDDGFEKNITDINNIRTMLEQIGNNLLGSSVQDQLVLEPIKGKAGEGYLFNLTDKSTKPGEYKYLTQGALSMGEILLVFSLFTQQPVPLFREKVLEMIQSAVHKFHRQV